MTYDEIEYIIEVIVQNWSYILFVSITIGILTKIIKYGFIYLIISAIARHECRKMLEVTRHGKKK